MLNQVILVGRLTAIVKKKGKIESFKVIVPRINELKEDRPIVVVPPEMGESIYGLIKDDIVVGVKARIETEVKGGFGTVTKIVAQKITVLNKTEDQMDTDRIRKVAKEHGEEVVGALMMDTMDLSDNPLNRYLPEESLDDETENDDENLSYKGKLAKSPIPDSDVPGFE